MSANDNDWGWDDLLKGLAVVGVAASAVYLSEKAEEEKIDQLLNLSFDEALILVAQTVPPMNNDTWQDFQRRLARRAEYSQQAENLLYFARCIVTSEKEVQQIVEYPMADAMDITHGLLRGKNDAEQLALIVCLQSSSNLKAQALLGNLLNS